METAGELLAHLLNQFVADGLLLAQEIETPGARPVLFGPARESEHKAKVGQLDDVETRQTAAFEINVHAGGEGQQRFDQAQPAPSPGADGSLLSVIMLSAAEPNDLFPWLKHNAGVF